MQKANAVLQPLLSIGLLIGNDGHTKLAVDDPDLQQLFTRIGSLPMCAQELRESLPVKAHE